MKLDSVFKERIQSAFLNKIQTVKYMAEETWDADKKAE
jgi:hypothetical protein